jgi:hypothetical protein
MDDINFIHTCNDLLELQEMLKNEPSEELSTGKITRSNLINAWEHGVISSDKTYVFLIIFLFYTKDELKSLVPEEFCLLWEGMGIDGKKPKELKPSSVVKALIDIEDAQIISIKNAQLLYDVELHNS